MNTMTEKPTPGPHEVRKFGDTKSCSIYAEPPYSLGSIRNRGDAELYAEAGTVYHETGLTPHQVADQRAELIAVLEGFVESAEIDCYCDELILMAKPCCVCKASAALARAKAVPK